MQLGDQLEIVADEMSFQAELRSWCKVLGHGLLSLVEQDGQLIARIARVQKR
jgi:TusA-related sulfurtransferase